MARIALGFFNRGTRRNRRHDTSAATVSVLPGRGRAWRQPGDDDIHRIVVERHEDYLRQEIHLDDDERGKTAIDLIDTLDPRKWRLRLLSHVFLYFYGHEEDSDLHRDIADALENRTKFGSLRCLGRVSRV